MCLLMLQCNVYKCAGTLASLLFILKFKLHFIKKKFHEIDVQIRKILFLERPHNGDLLNMISLIMSN